MTPEMIDAAVINLRTLLTTTENVPENVTESGKKFVDALDEWSTQMKASSAA